MPTGCLVTTVSVLLGVFSWTSVRVSTLELVQVGRVMRPCISVRVRVWVLFLLRTLVVTMGVVADGRPVLKAWMVCLSLV